MLGKGNESLSSRLEMSWVVMATRRMRSQGRMITRVAAVRSHMDLLLYKGVWLGSIMVVMPALIQRTASDSQPPKRWMRSNWLCIFSRRRGMAVRHIEAMKTRKT